MTLKSWLFIAVGSAAGGVLRHAVGLLALGLVGDAFPWGTLIINVVGSLVMGFCFAFSASGGPLAGDNAADLRLLLMVGLCGGFTTFSSFSLQTLTLFQDGAWPRALAYVAASVVACLLAVAAGVALVRA